jgi:iron(III) transport system ATP-binding protein
MNGSPTKPRAVDVRDLRKVYEAGRENAGHLAVDSISFHIDEGEFYTLLGPSGCGKTTTMRCIAGLEGIDGGSIAVFGSTVSAFDPPTFVHPSQRGMGMVFQSYAIWPHLSVFENVAFPLRVGSERTAKAEITRRVGEALELVQLGAYEKRMATQLSGGQQQRLALARAIVGRPQLLLLDEPLSNLDARLRDAMRTELRAIQQRLGVTTIFVTHDQVEALSMSTRIAVLNHGRIVQEGRPRELYLRPRDEFVASFLGNSNVFPGTVAAAASDVADVRAEGVVVRVAVAHPVALDEAVTLAIRPENCIIHDGPVPGDNVYPAEVEVFTFLGELAESLVKIGGMRLRVRHSPARSYQPGEAVFVELPIAACALISDRGMSGNDRALLGA